MLDLFQFVCFYSDVLSKSAQSPPPPPPPPTPLKKKKFNKTEVSSFQAARLRDVMNFYFLKSLTSW